MIIFAARALHSRTLLKVRINLPRFLTAIAVLVLECVLVEGELVRQSILCCAVIAALYVKPLLKAARSGLAEIFSGKGP